MESPSQPTNQDLPTLPVWQVVLSGDKGKDKPFQECEAICVWLLKNTSGYLVGEHPSKWYKDPKTLQMEYKGIHCHILIEGLKVSRTALEKEIKKYVSKGKGAILTCFKPRDAPPEPYDKDKLATYILKGQKSICKATSYTEEYIVERVQAWIEPVRDEFEVVDFTKSTPVKKVKTTFQHCQEIVEYLEKWEGQHRWSAKEIVSAIIKYCRENKLPLSAYKARDWYDCIMMIKDPERYNDTIVNLITKRDGYVF